MVLDKNDLKAIGNLMDKKIEELARMIAGSFEKVHSEMADGFGKVYKEFDNVHKEINSFRLNVDNKFARVHEDIERISFEVTEIKLALKKERKWTVEDVDLIKEKIEVIEDEVDKIKLKLKTT